MDPEILREVYRHAPLPWTLMSLEGRILAVNPAACEFFGYAEDDLVGSLTPMAARPKSPRHATSRVLVGHLLDGTIDRYEDEKSFVRKDGAEVWGRLTCTVVRDADGEPQHFMALWHDITSQKRAEDALQVAEERFLAAFDHAPIGMALTDLAGKVLQSNPAIGVMTEVHDGERCGLLRLPPTDLRRLVDREAPFVRHEQAHTARTGEPRWVETTASLVRRSDGVPLYLLWQVEDVTDRRRTTDELAWRATHDPLTGLPNRTMLMDRLTQTLARREGTATVLFCDLDRLKAVNDRLGHDAGDRLLVAVAARLAAALRPADTLARLGGDELVVVCEDLDDGGAAAVAARLLDGVAAASLEAVAMPGSASIGLVIAPVGSRPEDVLRRADDAMYEAKAAGGNRFAQLRPAPSPRVG